MEHHELPGAIGACRRSTVCMFLLLKCTDLFLLQPRVALGLQHQLLLPDNASLLLPEQQCAKGSYSVLSLLKQLPKLLFPWLHACALSWAAADETEEPVIVATKATVTAVD